MYTTKTNNTKEILKLLIIPYMILSFMFVINHIYDLMPTLVMSMLPIMALLVILHLIIGFLLAILSGTNKDIFSNVLPCILVFINIIILVLPYILAALGFNDIPLYFMSIRNFNFMNFLIIGVHLYFIYHMIKNKITKRKRHNKYTF